MDVERIAARTNPAASSQADVTRRRSAHPLRRDVDDRGRDVVETIDDVAAGIQRHRGVGADFADGDISAVVLDVDLPACRDSCDEQVADGLCHAVDRRGTGDLIEYDLAGGRGQQRSVWTDLDSECA